VGSILWVDDNPKNNSFLVERLTNRGIQVTQVLSTSEALSLMKTRSYDRVISDMGRQESSGYNSSAGLDLIKAMRDAGAETPIAFFCSRSAVSTYGREALQLGAKAITSSSTELLQALEIEL
jgi:CheY-like chemotaxis protein